MRGMDKHEGSAQPFMGKDPWEPERDTRDYHVRVAFRLNFVLAFST